MAILDNISSYIYIYNNKCSIILKGYSNKNADILINNYVAFLNDNYENGWQLVNVIKFGTVSEYYIERITK